MNAIAREVYLMRESHLARFSGIATKWSGSSAAFAIACLIIIIWLISGPFFGFSDTWQLVINTGTSITTFLMVFLIQNTQNRDARAMHLKLDELIRGVEGARTHLMNLEQFTDEELDQLQAQFQHVRAGASSRHLPV